MEKRQLKIDLLGASFTIQSTESPEHLARVAGYLRARIEEVRARYSLADPLRVALLAALNVADELFREREGHGLPGADTELATVAQKLIDSIDESLLDYTPYRPQEKNGMESGGAAS